MAPLSGEWLEALKGEFHQPYYAKLYKTVMQEYQTHKIFPPADDMFNAFHFTPLSQVKVVILGQDPYHNDGQAHGLCFSVKRDVEIPPSLVNIYQELHDDLGCYIPDNGYLEKWARQGVLMLNTVLTVRAHQANSHRGIGWEQFTDAAIGILNEQDRPIVFLLWGRPAQMKKSMLTNPKHLILEAPHPSPLSAYRGFFGCRHFSKTNEFLIQNGLESIDWQIENKELHDDLGCYIPDNGYLEKWARQGVLMLNTVLTVRAHQANSHRGIGWEQFTDAAIGILNEQDRPIVFLLWGRPAQMKKSMLTNPKHLILEAPHPSPLSAYRGFFGCRHFSKTNEFLIQNGLESIDWQIENKEQQEIKE